MKWWYIIVIIADVAMTNISHIVYPELSAEVLAGMSAVEIDSYTSAQYRVWDVAQAGRVCLIPLVMLLLGRLPVWGEVVVANYLGFSVLDFVQELSDSNHGVQWEEWITFGLMNVMIFVYLRGMFRGTLKKWKGH